MSANNAIERVNHSLTLEEDLPLHIKGWKTQKVGGLLILILMLLTALGLFGEGPLSARKIVNGDITMAYERYLRYQKEMDVSLRLSNQANVQVAIPIEYLDCFRIEKIVPEANEHIISDGKVVYTFNVDKTGETILHFYLHAQKPGSAKGTWEVNHHNFQINQFIYP
ncbi:hypothetical protein [Olivibacter jilunii]|uniref:hypothetical protein n=1 Tax=Olivibacter jilunii TaxID=985016 RepID=UPI003F182C08